MLHIDKLSRQPLYEQIIRAVEDQVLTGILKEGEQLYSVRELSGELAINPNTIQKAYLDLDRRGIVASSPGIGSFVAPGALRKLRGDMRVKLYELDEIAVKLAVAEVDEETAVETVRQAYRKINLKRGSST